MTNTSRYQSAKDVADATLTVVSMEDASHYYSQEIQGDEGFPPATYRFRASVWRELGEFDKSIEDYTALIRLTPGVSQPFTSRGHVWLEDKRDLEKALADFDEALRLNPTDTLALVGRGNVRRRQGAFQEALEAFDEAIRLEPDLGQAYCGRAYLWSERGELVKVRQDLDEAARRAPDDHFTWINRARLLATSPNDEHRDGKRAVADATKACELTGWGDDQALDSLAAACAETGDFAMAIQWEEKAIAQTRSAERADFETRLKLYREGKPYREAAAPPAADKSPPLTEPAKQ